MLAPGASFTAGGRLVATLTAAPAPTIFINGVGFSAAGEVLFDSDVPAGEIYLAGIRRSAVGAMYGTVTVSATDTILGGVRLSVDGAVVVVQSDPLLVVNGNPLIAAGELCIA